MRCLCCGPCCAEGFRMFILDCTGMQSFCAVLLRAFLNWTNKIDIESDSMCSFLEYFGLGTLFKSVFVCVSLFVHAYGLSHGSCLLCALYDFYQSLAFQRLVPLLCSIYCCWKSAQDSRAQPVHNPFPSSPLSSSSSSSSSFAASLQTFILGFCLATWGMPRRCRGWYFRCFKSYVSHYSWLWVYMLYAQAGFRWFLKQLQGRIKCSAVISQP